MKMDSKSYTAGYNQAIIDNKKKVAELKKDSIDGKEIGFDSETGGYYFWNKENDVEFDLDSYILIKKSDFEKRLGKWI